MVILIDVHGDDCALFCAHLALRYKPSVVVTHLSVPIREVDEAMDALGCKWTSLPLEVIPQLDYEVVIAPAWEKAGLPEHNLVAEFVNEHFPDAIRYLTYAGHPRRKSRSPNEVEFKPEWLFAKHRALAAFESQAATPSWVHFQEDLREYIT